MEKINSNIINLNLNQDQLDVPMDYANRKLNFCGVCKLIYNVGDRIPRILVNCGHTWCTNCLSKYYRKNRIRCPNCKKMVKNLENVEQLPLNINIFSEIIYNDPDLFDMIDPESSNSYAALCSVHSEKQKHFYCSHHQVSFCRECIKTYHRDDNCCVVDLYDINKLYQLNEQNQNKNYLIVKTRMKAISHTKIHKDEFFIANS
jgi:hypothetical protein